MTGNAVMGILQFERSEEEAQGFNICWLRSSLLLIRSIICDQKVFIWFLVFEFKWKWVIQCTFYRLLSQLGIWRWGVFSIDFCGMHSLFLFTRIPVRYFHFCQDPCCSIVKWDGFNQLCKGSVLCSLNFSMTDPARFLQTRWSSGKRT